VWTVKPVNVGPGIPIQAVLRAYNAADISQELWNSTQDPSRDAVGNFDKFNPPTVANGRVYVATFSNRLIVYGTMGAPWILTQPQGQVLGGGQSAVLSAVVSGRAPLIYQWYRGQSGDTHNPVGPNSASFAQPYQPGTYWLRVTNTSGSADSISAILAFSSTVYLPVATVSQAATGQ
jgi:hypothetical protein